MPKTIFLLWNGPLVSLRLSLDFLIIILYAASLSSLYSAIVSSLYATPLETQSALLF